MSTVKIIARIISPRNARKGAKLAWRKWPVKSVCPIVCGYASPQQPAQPPQHRRVLLQGEVVDVIFVLAGGAVYRPGVHHVADQPLVILH